MLNIFYADAGTDKDRFLFDKIAEQMPQDIFLIVPDQFTLQAERNAFRYMNADALLQLEILSRTGFVRRIVSQEGKPAGIPVDKYGRYMLLAKIMLQEKETNGIFSEVRMQDSFITLVNDMISELKQHNVSPKDFEEIADKLDKGNMLTEKIADFGEIFAKYEKELEGKFTDSENLQTVVNEEIYRSKTVKSHIFWFFGFDYMTPKMLSMVEAVAACSPEVNIIFTGTDLPDDDKSAIFNYMRRSLKDIAAGKMIPYSENVIPRKYAAKRNISEVRLYACSDIYAEAESVAVEITELVRDKGLRYSDIAVICNDMDVRAAIFERTFKRYEIPVFMDRKRGLLSEPSVEFIFAMIDVIRKKRRFNDVFRMIKTGFSPIRDVVSDELENYCRKYKISGNRWKKEFTLGIAEEGEEKLERLNIMREKLNAFISEAENLFKGKKTVREKTEALYIFLTKKAHIPGKIDLNRSRLEAERQFDYSQSAAQIWKATVIILDQMVQVLGDEEMTDEDYVQILSEGFSEYELGLLPTTNDQVIFGTMMRTRTGEVKALFICGANDGVLPKDNDDGGIFSDDEMHLLNSEDRRVCKTNDIRDMEEELALHKMMMKAQDYIYVTWSETDETGSEIRASEVVRKIRNGEREELRTARVVEGYDVLRSGDVLRLIQRRESTLPHLTDALRKKREGGELADEWKAAAGEYEGNEFFAAAQKGLLFSNKIEKIEAVKVKALYGRGASEEIVLGTSAFERFSRCPFSFLIRHGLRPREERDFSTDARSIGDVYHECMRAFSDYLTEPGVEITAKDSKWMTIDADETKRLTDKFVEEYAKTYREGVFFSEDRDDYVRARIKDVCARSVWMMIGQVRSGHIKEIKFEQRFGLRSDAVFPPIRLVRDDGEIVLEGITDRIDILSVKDSLTSEERSYVKIIDYKSGQESFDLNEAESGYRLQLMIYLKNAMENIEKSYPAGVFYFKIVDEKADVSEKHFEDIEDAVNAAAKKNAKLDGVLVENIDVIKCMDEKLGKSSEIIPAKMNKEGKLSGSVITEQEFFELIETNDDNLYKIADSLLSGCVDIEPKKGKNSSPCTFCDFKSICNKA